VPDLRIEPARRVAVARYALWAVFALAVLVRLVPLTYSHFWDEVVFLQHARIILDGRTNYDEFIHRPPLLPFAYALGLAIWNSNYSAQVVQAILSALVVPFGFLFTRRAFGDLPAYFAAPLFAFTPYLVDRSHELLTDAPAVVLMLAAMWLAERPGSRSALAAGVTSGLAVLMRFTSLFIFPYFVLSTIVQRRSIARLACVVAAAGVTVVPYLVWVHARFGSPFYTFEHARRITVEWTAPVPLGFYDAALAVIFPTTLALFFIAGIGFAIARARGDWSTGGASAIGRGPTGHVATLVVWGAAFFAYMSTIPHKEVRYLLPLTIPVVVVAALGMAETWRLLRACGLAVRVVACLAAAVAALIDYCPAFDGLTTQWIDRSQTEAVQIARYLHEVSGPGDTVYAAHEFPVLAYYSERRTVSVLPIQQDFERQWRTWMRAPGYFVYFPPQGLGETHTRNPQFKPDRTFLESSPEFRPVRVFSHATVYRYDPALP